MLMMMMMIFSHENIVTGGERNADEDEKKIGDREVQDQQICCVLHLRVRHHLANIDVDDMILIKIRDQVSSSEAVPLLDSCF